MTDEAHGDTPEEGPAPPTSTRWSEDAVAEDDAPPPPFVPGRPGPLAEATPGTEPAVEGTPEGGAEPTEPEPFPFELPVDADEPEAAEEAAAAEEDAAATDTAEDDFPFERFDIEGRGKEAGTPDRAGSASTAESDMGGGWSPADVLEQEREEVLPAAAEPAPEPEPEPFRDGPAIPAHAAPSSPAGPSDDDAVEEAASLLDRLADTLRGEGEAGLRREIDSPDRLTAVLAGILAGYLSGRS